MREILDIEAIRAQFIIKMNYTGMTLDQFLQARKLKVEKAEGEDDVSENEKMFWEYNELMKHVS